MSLLVLLAVSAFHFCDAFPSRRDGPLGMDELNMLHADAVKFGQGVTNLWFTAIDAKTLDSLITEMNEMNRWFAKVVKYWDDFTSGGDGSTVLEQNGKGIKKLQDKGDAEEEGAGDDAAAADAEGTDGADAEEGADGTAAADGEEGAETEDAAAADGAEEDAAAAAADGEDAAAADAAGDDAAADTGDAAAKETPAARRRRMRRRNRRV